MSTYADSPVETLEVGKRNVSIWVTQLEDGQWAVDYEAHAVVIAPALMTMAKGIPRRRCLVAPTREEALKKARERFRMMYGTYKLRSVNPNRLAYH